MSYSLGLRTATAAFGPTFPCPGAAAVKITVLNAAVDVQLGEGSPAAPLWNSGDPSFLVPGVHTLPGPLDALRVRASAPIVTGKEPRYALDAV